MIMIEITQAYLDNAAFLINQRRQWHEEEEMLTLSKKKRPVGVRIDKEEFKRFKLLLKEGKIDINNL